MEKEREVFNLKEIKEERQERRERERKERERNTEAGRSERKGEREE